MINYIVGGAILGLMVFAALRLFKKSKNGKNVCGCGCSGCPSGGSSNSGNKA